MLLLVLICVAATSAPAARRAGYDDLLTLFKDKEACRRPREAMGEAISLLKAPPDTAARAVLEEITQVHAVPSSLSD